MRVQGIAVQDQTVTALAKPRPKEEYGMERETRRDLFWGAVLAGLFIFWIVVFLTMDPSVENAGTYGRLAIAILFAVAGSLPKVAAWVVAIIALVIIGRRCHRQPQPHLPSKRDWKDGGHIWED